MTCTPKQVCDPHLGECERGGSNGLPLDEALVDLRTLNRYELITVVRKITLHSSGHSSPYPEQRGHCVLAHFESPEVSSPLGRDEPAYGSPSTRLSFIGNASFILSCIRHCRSTNRISGEVDSF
jgi:hypothetical protein